LLSLILIGFLNDFLWWVYFLLIQHQNAPVRSGDTRIYHFLKALVQTIQRKKLWKSFFPIFWNAQFEMDRLISDAIKEKRERDKEYISVAAKFSRSSFQSCLFSKFKNEWLDANRFMYLKRSHIFGSNATTYMIFFL
jgi:hypothetical protein